MNFLILNQNIFTKKSNDAIAPIIAWIMMLPEPGSRYAYEELDTKIKQKIIKNLFIKLLFNKCRCL